MSDLGNIWDVLSLLFYCNVHFFLLFLPGVFDNLIVKTAEGSFPLIQLGQVIVKNPQLIAIDLSSSPQVKFLFCKNIASNFDSIFSYIWYY